MRWTGLSRSSRTKSEKKYSVVAILVIAKGSCLRGILASYEYDGMNMSLCEIHLRLLSHKYPEDRGIGREKGKCSRPIIHAFNYLLVHVNG